MKTLMVYYSFSGNNEKLAQHVREMADCDLLRIKTRKKRTRVSIFLDFVLQRKPEIKTYAHRIYGYDQIILIAPVWMGRIAAPMKTFVQQEKPNMHRYAFITVCGGVAGQRDKLWKELTHMVGAEPVNVTELWLADLLSTRNGASQNVTTYQLTEEDLAKFTPKIQAFLEEVLPEFETT